MRKFLKIAVTLLTGFFIAMILMGIVIYFGYTQAYASNVETLTVKLAGIPIYELTKTGAEYMGTTLGTNMGIICGIFILLSFCVSGMISKVRKAHK